MGRGNARLVLCVRQWLLEQSSALLSALHKPEPMAAKPGQGGETLDVKCRKHRERGAGGVWLMCLSCWLLLSLHFSTSQLALSLASIPQHSKECLLLTEEKGTGA